MAHGGTSTDLHVDIAPGFGGQGVAPDPLQYLLAGLGAGYASTVVTVADVDDATLARWQETARAPSPTRSPTRSPLSTTVERA